jgi:hypothetical protein
MTFKNPNYIWVVILVIVIVLFMLKTNTYFIGATVGQGGTSIVTREVFSTPAYINSNVNVKLDVHVGAKNECDTEHEKYCNDFYVISEQIPLNAQFISLDGRGCSFVNETPKRIVCIILSNTESNLISYTLKTYDTPSTSYFLGTYMFEGDSIVNTIDGDNLIEVIEEHKCLTSWNCSNWDQWTTASNSCGIRRRICNDLNNCNLTINVPSTFEEKTCPIAICGNNITEIGEVCDGTDLGGNTCAINLGASLGNLKCMPNCKLYDTSECTGNNTRCMADWECDEWSSCLDGNMTRSCRDTNNCQINNGVSKPETIKTCEQTININTILIIGSILIIFILLTITKNVKK